MALVLHESAEMYLETIHRLTQEQDMVRSVDVANAMGYSKPTISEWVNKLSDAGYINISDHGALTLTDAGLEVATKIFERHQTLTQLFEALGVNPDTAEEDACRVEHYISDETFMALKKHLSEHGQ